MTGILMRLLVVEDEPDLLDIIGKRLSQSGYSVDLCQDGEEADYYMEHTIYDIIILDIMLPKIDGITLLKRLRKREDKTPVLLLTAKDSIDDRVAGLDSGADDYLSKPFAFDELLARIRVLLRRKSHDVTNEIIIGDLNVDFASHKIIRAGSNINLSSKEFAIFEYLVRNRGIVLSREQIEEHVWNYDFEGGSNIVDVYIRYLRKKIDTPFDKKLIHTIRGTGYILREDA